jgi:hypothetical protein
MEDSSAVAHPDFRFYLTAGPAPAEFHIMPSGILQACKRAAVGGQGQPPRCHELLRSGEARVVREGERVPQDYLLTRVRNATTPLSSLFLIAVVHSRAPRC